MQNNTNSNLNSKKLEAEMVLEGLKDIEAGRTVDGEETVRKIREKYDL